MHYLNLGILAHVDAGKTSLTERILFAAGVIDAMGRVDDGTTQTDSLALERRRGITIKSAVVSFVVDGVTVNLIDTPGHPDFIAEVERVLDVLDGAVLVISAVEGVQPQTRVLMRALQRSRIPTLLFVNKIDRAGAHPGRALQGIAEKLTPAIVAMGAVADPGARDARFVPYDAGDAPFVARLVDVLADRDEALLAAYVQDEGSISYGRLRDELAAQTGRALVHPVFYGSAITGTGVDALIAGIRELLPVVGAHGDDGPVSGGVFKIERGSVGEKIAYVRMFSGAVAARERVRFGGPAEGQAPPHDRAVAGGVQEGRVTAIRVFDGGRAVPSRAVAAGQIGKLWGLGAIRVGDAIGTPRGGAARRHFAPPTLETVIVPERAADRGALHAALTQLAEQDPLIALRVGGAQGELSVLLYGEVQKEVIGATLADEFGLAVAFRETTPIYVERPRGSGAAAEMLGTASNPFIATVGLRVDPAPPGNGVTFRSGIVRAETIPLYIYKTVEAFEQAIEGAVRDTLRQGLHGWEVVDCMVTLTQSGYVPPASTARDFRLLTPLALMGALQAAGTVVCEPLHRFHLETPADTLGAILPALARLRAVPGVPEVRGASCVLEGEIPAARVHELQQQLPALTHGDGVLDHAFDHYEPVQGATPTRSRSGRNPLNRKEYLLHVARQT